MALIRCEDVSIGYEGQTVVRDLDFSIGAGDYLCIVGENGSADAFGSMKPIYQLHANIKENQVNGRVIFLDQLHAVIV